MSVVHIWTAKDMAFDPDKSGRADMMEGYLWDDNSGESKKSIYTQTYTDRVKEDLPPGKYFIFAIAGDNMAQYGIASFSYTYTEFEIAEGEAYQDKKVFERGHAGFYHPW